MFDKWFYSEAVVTQRLLQSYELCERQSLVLSCYICSTLQRGMPTKTSSTFILFVCVIVLMSWHISIYSPLHTICQDKMATFSATFPPSDTLFSNDSKITHCITGDAVGIRPSVPLVSFRELSYHKGAESSDERRASFSNIFQKRQWGINRLVKFSASGNLHENRDCVFLFCSAIVTLQLIESFL